VVDPYLVAVSETMPACSSLFPWRKKIRVSGLTFSHSRPMRCVADTHFYRYYDYDRRWSLKGRAIPRSGPPPGFRAELTEEQLKPLLLTNRLYLSSMPTCCASPSPTAPCVVASAAQSADIARKYDRATAISNRQNLPVNWIKLRGLRRTFGRHSPKSTCMPC